MISETELFYLIIAILLTFVIHLVLSSWGGHRNRMSH